MKSFPTLFSPIRIGPLELRNRLVMAPMETSYASRDGIPTPRSLAYYEARAKGGVGLITLGACSIDERHREVLRTMDFGRDEVVEAHRDLTARVHAAGARIQPQLVHPGPDGLAPHLSGIPNLGPSVIPSYLTGIPCRALEPDELPPIVEAFARAAVRVREAGYDGIELHAAHGYMLLGSFLSPIRNRRSDAYGGGTREGRIRLLVEVVRAIKRATGSALPITLRLSGYERTPGGRPIHDTAQIAPLLVAAGVDAFHVSGGVIDPWTTQMVAGSQAGDAPNIGAAAALKQVVDVPVIAVGRIHDPVLAERLLVEGRADLIAMGRPLLADPEFAQKARLGRAADIRRCISCENCIDAMETRYAMDCAINPRTGRERELRIVRTSERKHVVVIGGGPAGLEAARVAAERGHRVDLYERDRRLGGAFALAATVHPENEPFLDYLIRGARRQPDLTLHCGEALDADAIARLAPDAVIVATGGRVVAPKLAGADLPHVVTGARLRELLAGRVSAGDAAALPRAWQLGNRLLAGPAQRLLSPALLREATRSWLPLGRRVAIVGADLAAIELAEFLARRGRRVCVLDGGDDIAPEVGAKRRDEHMAALDRARVSVNTGVAIDRIDAAGVVLRLASGAERNVAADSVILAGAVEADTTLFEAVSARVPRAFAVGDCTGLGLVQKATLDAARAACSL